MGDAYNFELVFFLVFSQPALDPFNQSSSFFFYLTVIRMQIFGKESARECWYLFILSFTENIFFTLDHDCLSDDSLLTSYCY